MKYTKKPVTIEAEQWFPPAEWPSAYPCPDPRPEFNKSVTFLDKEHALVHTIHQGQTVKIEPGDYIIPEPDGIHFYPCKEDVFKNTYEDYKGARVPSFLEELDRLQDGFYPDKQRGEIIGLLGLFGEAGEVLDEVVFDTHNQGLIENAINVARNIDALKKRVRSGEENVSLAYIESFEKYNTELADCFYYLNILRKNRGLSFNDLAEMSLKKIAAKGAAAKG